MLNQKIIKICEQKFIYLNYSQKTKDNYKKLVLLIIY